MGPKNLKVGCKKRHKKLLWKCFYEILKKLESKRIIVSFISYITENINTRSTITTPCICIKSLNMRSYIHIEKTCSCRQTLNIALTFIYGIWTAFLSYRSSSLTYITYWVVDHLFWERKMSTVDNFNFIIWVFLSLFSTFSIHFISLLFIFIWFWFKFEFEFRSTISNCISSLKKMFIVCACVVSFWHNLI